MPTSKKRILVSLPKGMAVFLKRISLRDDVPQATKAVELLDKALELEEDEYFSVLATERDTRGATCLSHKEAWE
jgi:predicted DNA-binding protein